MLTPDQLTAIDRHLRKENWLLNEELIAELTDHYVTKITDHMAAGKHFNAALYDVHKDFGERQGLLKMEEEYAAGQYLKSRNAFRQIMGSYFKPLRIILTVCLFFGFLWLLKIDPHRGRYEMIAGSITMFVLIAAALLGLGIVIQKFRQQSQKAYRGLAGRHIGAMLMGYGFINVFVWAYGMTSERLQSDYHSVYLALLLTLVTVYAFSIVEYARLVIRKSTFA